MSLLMLTGVGMAGFLIAQNWLSLEALRTRADNIQLRMVAGWTRGLALTPLLGADIRARRRIDRLELQVRTLSHWRETARQMSEQLRLYEQRLNLESESEQPGIWGRLIAEADSPFARTRLLDIGARQGVEVGSAAIAEGRLIGHVIRVGTRSCRIMLLDNYDSRIPVMSVRSRDRAILTGEAHGQARLSHMAYPQRLIEGDTWISSGDGGLFGRGLVVGRLRNDGAKGWFIHVPSPRSEWVRLLPPPRPQAPEDTPPVAPMAKIAILQPTGARP